MIALFLCHQSYLIPWATACEHQQLPVSSIMSHPMTNRMWVKLLYFLYQTVSSIMSHPMTNSQWVTLLYFFAMQSHQSHLIPWPTASEWHCFISLPVSLINHTSSHDQQAVSGTALCLCQAPSVMSHPITNRQWVTLLTFFARLSHQSCLILWPTASEWHQRFISLRGCLINHVSSHDKQAVSDTG